MKILCMDIDVWTVSGLSCLLEGKLNLECQQVSIRDSKAMLAKHNVEFFITELASQNNNVSEVYNFLKLLNARLPWLKIIIFTRFEDNAVLRFFFDNLTHAVIITKRDPICEIQDAANNYNAYYIKNYMRWKHLESHLNILNKTEFQLLQCFSNGEKQVDIAARYNLSNKTISTYKRSILTKLSCSNHAELNSKLKAYGYKTDKNANLF